MSSLLASNHISPNPSIHSSPRSVHRPFSLPMRTRRGSSLFRGLRAQDPISNATPNEDPKPPNGDSPMTRREILLEYVKNVQPEFMELFMTRAPKQQTAANQQQQGQRQRGGSGCRKQVHNNVGGGPSNVHTAGNQQGHMQRGGSGSRKQAHSNVGGGPPNHTAANQQGHRQRGGSVSRKEVHSNVGGGHSNFQMQRQMAGSKPVHRNVGVDAALAVTSHDQRQHHAFHHHVNRHRSGSSKIVHSNDQGHDQIQMDIGGSRQHVAAPISNPSQGQTTRGNASSVPTNLPSSAPKFLPKVYLRKGAGSAASRI